jgi:acyl carrier protein
MVDIHESIREVIYRMASEKNIVITETANLYNSGIMDSLNIIVLLSELQTKFSIEMTDDVLDPGNFESIDSICQMISSIKIDKP